MISIWNTLTGEELVLDTVDAREILAANPGLYTLVSPYPPEPPGPRDVEEVEDPYRREPVGEDPPEPERDEVIIRNVVGDKGEKGWRDLRPGEQARYRRGGYYVPPGFR